MTLFIRSYQVAWGDLDANRHMANSAYVDYGTQTRFAYLASVGLGPDKMIDAGRGVVLFEERVQYRSELRFLDEFTVDVRLGGLSASGSRFEMVSRMIKADGTLAAIDTIHAGWFDLATRRVRGPDAETRAAIDGLERTEEFRTL